MLPPKSSFKWEQKKAWSGIFVKSIREQELQRVYKIVVVLFVFMHKNFTAEIEEEKPLQDVLYSVAIFVKFQRNCLH